MHQYVDQTGISFGVRLLANNYSVEKVKTVNGSVFDLINIPYFQATRIGDYLSYTG